MQGQQIPAPTTEDGLTPAEVAAYHAHMRTLQADWRTTGSANRPAWLVRRVLGGK